MDYSWQMKCGSALQSSTQSMPSSSQEPRNQMEMNMGSIIYPHVGQDSRSATQRRIQDPIFPNMLNYRVDHADLGNSFLALLSGPSSLLQCDLQELSNPKPFSTSGKLPVDSSSVIASASGNGVPMTSSGLLSENLSKRNIRNGPEIYPLVSFRPVSSSICSSNSVLHKGIQPANSNIQSSDLAKLVFCPTVPGNEKVMNFCSLGGEWHSTSPVNDRRLQRINVQTSQKVPLEANSSVSNQPPTFMSGCPRVFCLGTSGDLLLSNTGLLGVVCSCHFLHMSLSKFCEHSGVYDVNPGDAVRMDSGETIAQWRKLYFQKFGQREHWMVMFL